MSAVKFARRQKKKKKEKKFLELLILLFGEVIFCLLFVSVWNHGHYHFPKILSSGSQLVETFKININEYLIFIHNFEFTSNEDITDIISCNWLKSSTYHFFLCSNRMCL